MLRTRVITAAVLLALFGLVLWIGSKAFALSSAIIAGLMVYEFLSVSLIPARRNSEWHKDDAVFYAALLTLPGLSLVFFEPQICFYLTAFAVAVFLIRECFLYESAPDEGPAKEVLAAFSIAFIYPFFFGLLFITSLDRVSDLFGLDAWRVILWFVLLVILSDTGAYFGGKAFGRTKLAPRISPNKTVEGAISGFICVVVFSHLLSELLKLTPSFSNQIIVAVIIGVLAPIGDLVESWIKRIYGVKDMGSMLPGHGGVFDRVDSYIFASLGLFFLTV
jgi:phosphatidate cytidylyltransferase